MLMFTKPARGCFGHKCLFFEAKKSNGGGIEPMEASKKIANLKMSVGQEGKFGGKKKFARAHTMCACACALQQETV